MTKARQQRQTTWALCRGLAERVLVGGPVDFRRTDVLMVVVLRANRAFWS